MIRPTLHGLAAAFAFTATLLTGAAAQAAAKVQIVTSPGGITAWLVEEQAIPIISVEIRFDGGAMLDPEGEEGVANLLSGMLDEGAGDLDSLQFSEARDAIAARIGFSAGRESFSVSAAMLAEKRDETIDLLNLALTQPRFDEEPMRRVKSQVLSGIRSDETDPNAIASKAFRERVYGDDLYARPTQGTVESVTALGPANLEKARIELLNVNAAHIAVVGAITAEELGPMLDRMMAGLPRGPVPSFGPAEFVGEPGIEVIDLDVPQSVAVIGHEGIVRDDPDYIPAYVMNYILGGGGFSSRLTEEVREKRGLAYSVYSYLLPADRAGLYMAGVATANPVMKDSIDTIRAEWRRMAEEGVTEEELEKAKRYLTGAYALRFDSNAKIADILVALQAAGFGPEYLDERNGMIEAVTVEDVARVAKRLMRADDLNIVVVGRPEGLPPAE